MYTIIYRDGNNDKWDRFETSSEVADFIRHLKDNCPDVCINDIWIFGPTADEFADTVNTFDWDKDEREVLGID